MSESDSTLYHIAFTQSASDPAHGAAWHRAIREAFPEDRPPELRMTASMTLEEFRAMTGRDDPQSHIGYLLEHYDGPGLFGIDMARGELDDLDEAIQEASGGRLRIVAEEDMSPEGCQAFLHVMTQTLDVDWKVQPNLVNRDFLKTHEEEIALFTTRGV